MRFYAILDRYTGKNVVVMVIMVAVCLTAFTGIITFIDKMRYIGRGSIDFWFVCRYVLFLTPGFLVTFFPVAVLIGGVIGLGNSGSPACTSPAAASRRSSRLSRW